MSFLRFSSLARPSFNTVLPLARHELSHHAFLTPAPASIAAASMTMRYASTKHNSAAASKETGKIENPLFQAFDKGHSTGLPTEKSKSNEWANKSKKKGSQISTKLPDLSHTINKPFHQSAVRRMDMEEVKDEAKHIKMKAKHKLQKAKHKVEEVGMDVKEGAHEAWMKTKEAANAVGEKIQSGAEKAGKIATTPLYEDDYNDQSVPPLYPTSDSAGAQSGVRVSNVTPEMAAKTSNYSMDKDNLWSFRKAIVDGPQTMPEGVGKRAIDDKGKPMETGAPRT